MEDDTNKEIRLMALDICIISKKTLQIATDRNFVVLKFNYSEKDTKVLTLFHFISVED